MKKIVLSTALILVFVIYAIYQNLSSFLGNSSAINFPAGDTSNSGGVFPANGSNPGNSSMMNGSLASAAYKDGTYVGSSADAYYGNVQVQVIIKSGRIANVKFMDYPRDRGTSVEINSQAMPMLMTEAMQTQNAQVNGVSGATETSRAFRESLASALTQAL